ITVIVVEQVKEHDHSKNSKITKCFQKLCCCCCRKKPKKREERFSRVGEFRDHVQGDNNRAVVDYATMRFKFDPKDHLNPENTGKLLEELAKVKYLVKKLSYHVGDKNAKVPKGEEELSTAKLILEARRPLDVRVVYRDGTQERFQSSRIKTTLRNKVPMRRPLSANEELIIVGGVKHQIQSMEIDSITTGKIHDLVVLQLKIHEVELDFPEEYDDETLPVDFSMRSSFDDLTSLECQALMGNRWRKG
ncbi:MAG: hypothetical protein K1000chlam4_00600, partial [Chlamydiae bacterium]|nr:hypothetical protein [Chlamydiota bacterium]